MPGWVKLLMQMIYILGWNVPIKVFVIVQLDNVTASLDTMALHAKELYVLIIVMTEALAGLKKF
jgi:hypothetical protein